MGSIDTAMIVADEQACTYAMKLAAASILPMTLKNAIELGILETLVAAGGKALSPSEVVARLPSTTANPGRAGHGGPHAAAAGHVRRCVVRGGGR